MRTQSANSIESRRLLLALPIGAAVLWLLGQRERPIKFDVVNVGIEAALALVEAGGLVIDVRNRSLYELKHIVGAISTPLNGLRTAIPTSIADITHKAILVYCGDGLTMGPEGTHILNKAGFVQAVNLQSGIEGWVAAGLPVRRG